MGRNVKIVVPHLQKCECGNDGGEKVRQEICIEVWGDFACYTPPWSKVERLTYPCPTPSAIRGLLSSIYAKPSEFCWQVTRIEVLNPIRYMSFMRNEVKSKAGMKTDVGESILYADEDRTQRQTQVLKDVRYRIAAEICPQPGYSGTVGQLYAQAMRRIRSGKTFCQPCLGLREFVCYFEESDGLRQPIDVSMDLGLMVYDVFDPRNYEVTAKTRYHLSLYHAVMKHGIIEVPPYDSEEVLKGCDRMC